MNYEMKEYICLGCGAITEEVPQYKKDECAEDEQHYFTSIRHGSRTQKEVKK